MPRKVRDASLETRTARARLKVAHKPYFRLIEPGLHLGYRKLANGPGTWLRRRYNGQGAYRTENLRTPDGALVIADDYSDANGETIMTFAQAQAAVKTRRPEARQTNGPYTVAAALTSYFAYLRHEGRPEDAVSEAEGRATALIVPKLGRREVATLTAEQFRAWRDALVKSGARLRTRRGELQKYREIDGDDEDAMRARRSSANRVWTILRAALNHAFAEGKAPSDKAWRQVKPFRGVDSARPHWLTVQQAKRAINAADPDFRKLVQAALLTGGRYGSLARLKARDFHERAGVVSLRTRKGDGTEKRFDVALTDEGLRFFRQACAGRQADDLLFTKADGTPWQKSDQARPMAALSEHAKIKPAVSFNVLRHTWASLAVMNGAPLLVVAKNLGHTDTRMVEKHYGHLAPSYVADAVRAHAPKFGLKPDNVRPLKVR